MQNMDLFLPLFLAGLILALKPGPHFMATVSFALDGRWRAMIVFWLSAVTAASINTFILLSGLSYLPEHSAFLFIFIKAAGAIMFVSMGLNSISKVSRINNLSTKKPKEIVSIKDFFSNIMVGILTALSNPYSIIFILTVIPAIAGTTEFDFFDIVVVRSAIIAADLVIIPLCIIPLLILHKKLSLRMVKKMSYASGICMVLVGLYLLVSLVTQWDLIISGLLSSL